MTLHTARCVRCLKPAKFWGGHVLHGRRAGERVLAGWCSERCANAKGFSGLFVEAMGIADAEALKEKK